VLSLSEQSASLPGSEADSSADLRRVRSLALRAASRARDAVSALSNMALRDGGILFEIGHELVVYHIVDELTYLGIAEL
jgi:hypothetical protein